MRLQGVHPALKAIDPGTQQDFEDMALDRELLAQAIDEFENEPPKHEGTQTEAEKP